MTRLALAFFIALTAAAAQAQPEQGRWVLVYAGCVAFKNGQEACASVIQRRYFPSAEQCRLVIPHVIAINVKQAVKDEAIIFWHETACRDVGEYKPPA